MNARGSQADTQSLVRTQICVSHTWATKRTQPCRAEVNKPRNLSLEANAPTIGWFALDLLGMAPLLVYYSASAAR